MLILFFASFWKKPPANWLSLITARASKACGLSAWGSIDCRPSWVQGAMNCGLQQTVCPPTPPSTLLLWHSALYIIYLLGSKAEPEWKRSSSWRVQFTTSDSDSMMLRESLSRTNVNIFAEIFQSSPHQALIRWCIRCFSAETDYRQAERHHCKYSTGNDSPFESDTGVGNMCEFSKLTR